MLEAMERIISLGGRNYSCIEQVWLIEVLPEILALQVSVMVIDGAERCAIRSMHRVCTGASYHVNWSSADTVVQSASFVNEHTSDIYIYAGRCNSSY